MEIQIQFLLYILIKINIVQTGSWRINNDSKRTADMYYPMAFANAKICQILNLKDITGICIASVVPESLFNIKSLIRKYFKVSSTGCW